MSKVSNTINKHHNKLLAAVAVLVVLMIIFVAYRLSQNQVNVTQDDSSAITETQSPFGKVLEVSNPTKLTIGQKTIIFPEGWRITSAYQNSDDAQYLCESSTSNCRIYVISNNTNTFYISAPTSIKDSEGPVTERIDKTISFGGVDTLLSYEKLTLVKKEGDDENAETSPYTDEGNDDWN